MKFGTFTKVGISWAFITAAGIYAFYLSKENIVQNRYDRMKTRERIRLSNSGEYEPSTRKYARTE